MSITSEAQAEAMKQRSFRNLLDYGRQTDDRYLKACLSPSSHTIYMPFTNHLLSEFTSVQALLSTHYFSLVKQNRRPSKLVTSWQGSDVIVKLIGYNEADNTLNFYEPHTLLADYCPTMDEPRHFVTCIINDKLSGDSYKFE
mgnify:FL=1